MEGRARSPQGGTDPLSKNKTIDMDQDYLILLCKVSLSAKIDAKGTQDRYSETPA